MKIYLALCSLIAGASYCGDNDSLSDYYRQRATDYRLSQPTSLVSKIQKDRARPRKFSEHNPDRIARQKQRDKEALQRLKIELLDRHSVLQSSGQQIVSGSYSKNRQKRSNVVQ